MSISTIKRRFVVFVSMLATVFVFVMGWSAVVMAGGEPGAGCEGDFKYDPPPFIGDLTLIWNETSGGLGDVSATGIVEQAGGYGCSGIFDNTIIIEDVSIDEFLAWDANFLKSSCIQNIGNFPFGCYGDSAYFSVVAVGGVKWMGESFTAKFVIMHLE